MPGVRLKRRLSRKRDVISAQLSDTPFPTLSNNMPQETSGPKPPDVV
jgi:hypothetical protein